MRVRRRRRSCGAGLHKGSRGAAKGRMSQEAVLGHRARRRRPRDRRPSASAAGQASSGDRRRACGDRGVSACSDRAQRLRRAAARRPLRRSRAAPRDPTRRRSPAPSRASVWAMSARESRRRPPSRAELRDDARRLGARTCPAARPRAPGRRGSGGPDGRDRSAARRRRGRREIAPQSWSRAHAGSPTGVR